MTLNFQSVPLSIFRGLVAIVLLASVGCVGPSVGGTPEEPAAEISKALGPGDILKISFPGTPELNSSPKIRLDGKVSLPLIGEVEVAGKTVEQLHKDLTDRYASQLQNKEVIVGLEASAEAVYVSGAVNKPGKILLDRPMTALDAIMESGGVSEFGSLKKVHVVRVVNGEHRTEYLSLSPILSGKTTKAYYLKAGDVVYVPN